MISDGLLLLQGGEKECGGPDGLPEMGKGIKAERRKIHGQIAKHLLSATNIVVSLQRHKDVS